ncbi:uncharacterized protein LOC129584818 [Paramacrobiotus metropolitanus]|uniref:uncharacterized protein LOC129584818 n=1 Tax=Paramacrobiotus metropolitanus TaxID=2943436 RepID=UPI0024459969|nr:uncharacterized protein LOC129584818 [Paramacrobiotus metropolitanus]
MSQELIVTLGDLDEKSELILHYTTVHRVFMVIGGLQFTMSIVELISAVILLEFKDFEEDPAMSEQSHDYNDIPNPLSGHIFGYLTILSLLTAGIAGIYFGWLCRQIDTVRKIARQAKEAQSLSRIYMYILSGSFFTALTTVGLELSAFADLWTTNATERALNPKHFPFSSAMIIVFGCLNIVLCLFSFCGILKNFRSLREAEKNLIRVITGAHRSS